jgi:hypothetical protein
MTRVSSVQVTVGMATREMRLASPKALTGAVAKVLA